MIIIFELGKGIQLHDGNDITVVATGLMVGEALKAVKSLEEQGVHAAPDQYPHD